MPPTASELISQLQRFDEYPATPRLNVHLLATAPGNEHLLAFMTDPVEDPTRFAGKQIGIIATHGAEEVEITIPRSWLTDRGAKVDILSPKPADFPAQIGGQMPEIAQTHILLIQFMTNSGWLKIDRVLEDVGLEDYDAVYVPGGAWNPDMLRTNETVLRFLRDFQATGRPLGAICHGPVVLLSAQLLRGRAATSFWAVQEDLRNGGAEVREEPAVVDGNIITGRFVFDIPQFVEALVAPLT